MYTHIYIYLYTYIYIQTYIQTYIYAYVNIHIPRTHKFLFIADSTYGGVDMVGAHQRAPSAVHIQQVPPKQRLFDLETH